MGIFSLAFIFSMGKFSPLALASQPRSYNHISTDSFIASFPFSQGDYINRQVFPDQVCFNASGSPATFSNVPLFSGAYPAWEVSYATNTWQGPISSWASQTLNSIQMRQTFTDNLPTGLPKGAFLLSYLDATSKLWLMAYDTSANLFATPRAGYPKYVGTVSAGAPHAMVLTGTKCHLFWVNTNILYGRALNLADETFAAVQYPFPFAAVNNTTGVSGTYLKDGGTQAIGIAFGYIASPNDITLVTFPQDDYTTVDSDNITVGAWSRPSFSLAQNPRTGKVFLLYRLADNHDYLRRGVWAGSAWTFSLADDLGVTQNLGHEVACFPNFETSLMNNLSSTYVQDFFIKTGPVSNKTDFIASCPTLFSFSEADEDYAGCILSGVTATRFWFWRRLLRFPQKFSWDKGSQYLHIEGPPLLSSKVEVTTFFPEMATGSCSVFAANANGKTVSLENADGVLASAGNRITLVFDRNMMEASFTTWVGDEATRAIRLFDSGLNPIPISVFSTSGTEVELQVDQDLDFASNYSVSIASNVLNYLGSQMWSAATFTFTTQKSQSGVVASEVVGLKGFSDAARSVEVQAGDEIPGISNLYFRLEAIDPAPNTIDLATISYFLNGAFVASLPFTQTLAATTTFHGMRTNALAAGPPATNTLVFVTASPTASLTVLVTFPVIASHSPTVAETGVLIDRKVLLDFTEPLDGSSVTSSNIRLLRGGILATFSVSVAGNRVTIDPGDIPPIGYLIPSANYSVEIGPKVLDLFGNPFYDAAGTYTTTFTTMASQTSPSVISSVSLSTDSNFLSFLPVDADFPATGTLYIRMIGADAQALTQDATVASLSNGMFRGLVETASSSGVFEGFASFAGLPTDFRLIVQSTVSPQASRSVLITYPKLSIMDPASGTTGVLIDREVVLTFTKNLQGSTVTKQNIRLFRNGNPASYAISLSGNDVTLDPDDIPGSGYMVPESVYRVEVGPELRDTVGNPFYNVPATFSATFTTQASRTAPLSIASVTLFSDAGFSLPIAKDSDFPATGTIWVRMTGSDAQSLTMDSTIASLSNSTSFTLMETASNSGIFQGPVAFAGLPTDFRLTIQSVVSPTASNSVLVTYPKLSVQDPASGTTGVLIDRNVVLTFTKNLNASTITKQNVRLFRNGAAASFSLSLANDTVTIYPDDIPVSGHMFPGTVYRVEVGPEVRDLLGNPFHNVPATYSATFTTQASQTPPLTVASITMFADPAFSVPILKDADSAATGTIWVRLTGSDAQPLTLDSTVASLSNSTFVTFQETASSSGIFQGPVTYAGLPSDFRLTIQSLVSPSASNSILVFYPKLTDQDPASGATGVLIDRSVVLTFSKALKGATVTKQNIRLFRDALPASYSLIFWGDKVTIDPDDIPGSGNMAPDTTYRVEIGPEVRDPLENPFFNVPATYSATFKTQSSQTTPLSIASVTLFADSGFTFPLAHDADFPATGTVWVRFTGSDSQPLTLDSTVASVSNSTFVTFSETASNSGIFQGPVSFAGLPHGFRLTIQSTVSPWASNSVTVNYPELFSLDPASGSTGISIDRNLVLTFTKSLKASSVTTQNVRLFRGGIPSSFSVSLSGNKVTIDPDDIPVSGHMSPDTVYRVEVGPELRDLLDNPFYNVPATFSATFETQASQTIPLSIASVTLFADPGYSVQLARDSDFAATGTIWIRMVGSDAQPLTRDSTLASVSNSTFVSLVETASSTGVFLGSVSFAGLPSDFRLTIQSSVTPSASNSVMITYPKLVSQDPASGTVGVMIDRKIILTFDKNLKASTVTKENVRLSRSGSPASFSVSLSGKTVTIDPDEIPGSGFLFPQLTYFVEIGPQVRDTLDNPFFNVPATYSGSFTTQASRTPPLSIASVSLFADASFTVLLSNDQDYPATGTVFIRLSGTDGASLTRDVAVASLSTGWTVDCLETASSSGVFQGSSSFAGLSDRFRFVAQSLETLSASASLLVTWPHLAPVNPASGAANVPVGTSITIQADERIDPSSLSATSARLLLGGATVPTSISLDGTRKILTITPASPLVSEGNYAVSVAGLVDEVGNPMVGPLEYSFFAEDIIPPTLVGFFPPDGTSALTIDQQPIFTFSEPMWPPSFTPGSFQFRRNGVPASFALFFSGSTVKIDPDDTPEGLLVTDAPYTVAFGPGIKDDSGNPFSNLPATFTLHFSTQASSTQPTTVDSLALYRDALFLVPFLPDESIRDDSWVFIKLTGTDGATQTRDVVPVGLKQSWNGSSIVQAYETASNSGGYFYGMVNLGTFSIHGFPAPLPSTAHGELGFSWSGNPARAATLSIDFPQWIPGTTFLDTLSGPGPASGATGVRLDSAITIRFDYPLDPATVSSSSVRLLRGGTDVQATLSLETGNMGLLVKPDSQLSPDEDYLVFLPFSSSGLKGGTGNPIFREVGFKFHTQPAWTPPSSVAAIRQFRDSSYSPFSQIDPGSDYKATGTVFLEAIGSDASGLTIDRTQVDVSIGSVTSLLETGPGTGVFRGSFSFAGLADRTLLRFRSAQNPVASTGLFITFPGLAPTQPASGSAGNSIMTLVQVTSDEALDPATVNPLSVRMTQVATSVPCLVDYGAASYSITLRPVFPLDFGLTYNVRIDGVTDRSGNPPPGPLEFQFTTQTTTVPPDSIHDLSVFSDPGRTVPVPQGALVLPGQMLYVQITADDLSSSTYDATLIEVFSKSATTTMSLVESSPSSGLFMGAVEVFDEGNTDFTIRSIRDRTFFRSFLIPEFPIVVGFFPASGTTDLQLDTVFHVQTNKPVSSASLDATSLRLADKLGFVPSTLGLPGPKDITVQGSLATDSEVFIEVNGNLKDADGLSFAKTLARFSTRAPNYTSFEIFRDSGLTVPVPDNSELPPGITLWTKLSGTDLRIQGGETLLGSWSDGSATFSFLLSENHPGEFIGNLTVPDKPGGNLAVAPEVAPHMVRNFKISQDFGVLSVHPASGAIGVPADVWPFWEFTHPVDSSFLVSPSTVFTIRRVGNPVPLGTTLLWTSDHKQLTLKPDFLLDLLGNYEIRVASEVADTLGRVLGTPFVTRFQVQAPPPPPSVVHRIWNFRDSTWSATSTFVPPDGTLFLEVVADDPSFSTVDSTRLWINSTDGSIRGVQLYLVETSANSGIFRASLPYNASSGATIEIISQGDPPKNLGLTVRPRPVLLSMNPASGSVGLHLDRDIELGFDNLLEEASLASGIRVLGPNGAELSLSRILKPDGRTVLISPVDGWSQGTNHSVELSRSLFDSNGISIAPTGTRFGTRGIGTVTLELYTGIAPRAGQSVSRTGEVVPGSVIILATATDLFGTRPETRLVRFTAAGWTDTKILNEVATSPGLFSGSSTIGLARGVQAAAVLEFGGKPALSFRVAPLPTLLGTNPSDGETGVPETAAIVASFSRPMARPSTAPGLTVISASETIATDLVPGPNPALTFTWIPRRYLPPGILLRAEFPAMTDDLGQPLHPGPIAFTGLGSQGITLFADPAFQVPIDSPILYNSFAYVESVASGPVSAGYSEAYILSSGSREVRLVPLGPAAQGSRRFRGKMVFEGNSEGTSVPLVPGEPVVFTSPRLNKDRKAYHFKAKDDSPPSRIIGINLFLEEHFQRRVEGDLNQDRLFIEVEGEDSNWLNADRTGVRIISDADPGGFDLALTESGVHSGKFQGSLKLQQGSTEPLQAIISIRPNDVLTVTSLVDPSVFAKVRYVPENRMDQVGVWPSPVRGEQLFFGFFLTFPGEVELTIHDSAGDEVDNQTIFGKAGSNVFAWRLPRKLANGVYFYTLEMQLETSGKGARKKRGKFAVLR